MSEYWCTRQIQEAYCEVCGFIGSWNNGLATAARHHRSTGHEVRVEVHRTVVYGPPPEKSKKG